MTEEKILKEEQMNEEELEQVAGGYDYEVYGDAERFNALGMRIGIIRDGGEVIALSGNDIKKIEDTFKEYGVTSIQNLGVYNTSHINRNQYFIDGKEVSRDEAWKHVRSQIK